MLTAYAASKWAVRGMSKVAAKELAQFGVRVNSLHPGQIDTDMNARQREQTPELIDKLIRGIPLRRIGTPEEVADAIVYLASDESVYVTGSELVIDGGSQLEQSARTPHTNPGDAQMSEINHQVRLAARPSGLPKDSDWGMAEEPVPTPARGSSWWRARTSRSTRRCAAG